MRDILYGWLERKLQAARLLREAARATGRFSRQMGGQGVFGQVTLSAVPAAEFSYTSRVIWPDEQTQIYEDCVLDGILDVLLNEWMHPILGVAVTLEEISWHVVDSDAVGCRMAAREAMLRIIAPEGQPVNYE